MLTSESTQNVWFITGTSSAFGRRLVAIILGRGDLFIVTARNLAKIQESGFFSVSSASRLENLRLLQLDIDSGSEAMVKEARERRTGTIVVIGSRTSWMPENPDLRMSKSATLSVELASFNIRVIIVEPEPNPDYYELRASAQAFYDSINGTQKGDRVKRMETVVDMVRGEGRAAEKEWPLYLPLGVAAENTIRDVCQRMLGILDEWKDVMQNVDVDQ
ncbi:hypothetical protein NEOLEDRAFT_1156057 [Neolentinus lepideus HHB14362 ss-1]|uniref:NAD(P)-binding domain-containing protein n=1 Tax=Neolentinus lepideus HHB14362 ss-1 TaxID=1314782 RepID=A0A165SZZ6_9AGAM|nr:hypothetical protein NEOLEDRAFT_1156057 [Neolentinus lepideus HHB14362 ss-1]